MRLSVLLYLVFASFFVLADRTGKCEDNFSENSSYPVDQLKNQYPEVDPSFKRLGKSEQSILLNRGLRSNASTTYLKDGVFSFEPNHDSAGSKIKTAKKSGKSNAEALRDIKLYRMRRTDEGV